MPAHDKGADLGDMWALQGKSAVHLACMCQTDECKVQCQMVQMLVAHGADINAEDDTVCGPCVCPV